MQNKTTPDISFDLQGAGEAFEGIKRMGLDGEKPLGEGKTKAPNSDYHKNESPVAARQEEAARDYLKRAERESTSSTATHRAPTGPCSPCNTPRSRSTTGAACWSS